jgi:hypothetical protein
VPPAGETAIRFPNNLQVIVSDGNLESPVTNVATVIATNKVLLSTTNTVGGVNKMVITFNKKLGTFSGNFLRPGDGLKTDFVGALLQNTTNAAGHFIGTDQSGKVIVIGD